MQAALVEQAERHRACPMPGYTHLQRAQPVLLAHHLLAYVFMLARDRERLADARRRLDVCPLGAAALAGTTVPVDRHALAQALGFRAATANSMDAVSDRDFALEFCAAAAIIATHLSRLAEELVLWASAEFGFVDLPDAYATGSSIMPQKKNPDVAELIRGKTGRVYGDLVRLLTVMKGLPLAYHSDMQEDKEAFFDAADTLRGTLGVLAPFLRALRFRTDRLRMLAGESFSTATDLAGYLVQRGLPFRDAHEVVGRAVRLALERGVRLEALPLEDLHVLSPLFGPDFREAVSVEASLAARNVYGGTAPEAVARALGGSARAPGDPLSRARVPGSAGRGGRVRTALALALLLPLPLAACGKRGPPVAPERKLPAAVQDLQGTVEGGAIRLNWTLPRIRVDRSPLKEIHRTEVYRRIENGAPEEPVRPALLVFGGLFGGATGRPRLRARRRHHGRRARPPAQVQGNQVTYTDAQGLAFGRRYTYVVIALDEQGRPSPPSNRVVVALAAAPEAPPRLEAQAGDAQVRLTWDAPDDAGGRVAGAAGPRVRRVPGDDARHAGRPPPQSRARHRPPVRRPGRPERRDVPLRRARAPRTRRRPERRERGRHRDAGGRDPARPAAGPRGGARRVDRPSRVAGACPTPISPATSSTGARRRAGATCG